MTVRTFPGTPTADLEVAWNVVATHENWKIEVHKELLSSVVKKLTFGTWNPVRLLGPDGTLWASAATVEEMKDALPELMTKFAEKKPLLTKEDLRKMGEALASVLLAAAARKVNAAPRSK